jgi:hypothetical protein
VFPIPLWEERLQIIIEKDPQKALQRANDIVKLDSIITITSASVKDGRVGTRGAIRDTRVESFLDWDRVITYIDRIGIWESSNTYIVELIAISKAIHHLANACRNRSITLLSSNLLALQALMKPKH